MNVLRFLVGVLHSGHRILFFFLFFVFLKRKYSDRFPFSEYGVFNETLWFRSFTDVTNQYGSVCVYGAEFLPQFLCRNIKKKYKCLSAVQSNGDNGVNNGISMICFFLTQ